eukprot:13565148-Alexandrium_andersonii.AAC.1
MRMRGCELPIAELILHGDFPYTHTCFTQAASQPLQSESGVRATASEDDEEENHREREASADPTT